MAGSRSEDKHVDIESVRVNGRFRKDLGDLEGLKRSISEVGLLHPVTVTADGVLVAGQRRLEALRQLGWRSVPIRVMKDLAEAGELLAAERDENTCRLDMKPSEMVALTERLKTLHELTIDRSAIGHKAVAAREAKRRGDIMSQELGHDKRRLSAAEKAAKAAGWNSQTYREAKEIVERAAQGEGAAQEALTEMDRTGQVLPAWRKLTGTPTPPKKDIDLSSERNRNVANARKNRLAKVLYKLEGAALGFDQFDDELRWVLAVAEAEDLALWDQILKQAGKSISDFRKRLQEGATP